MTIAISHGEQNDEKLPDTHEADAPPAPRIKQRLAYNEKSACTYVYPDKRQCNLERVDRDDPNGRCLKPDHQK